MDQGELAEQLALVSFFFGNLCKAILFFFRNNSLSESARCGNCYYTMTVFY